MISLEAAAAFARGQRADVLTDEPMCRHTSFRIGGPADLFITPGNRNSLAAIIAFYRENGLKYTVIGNGSNILVPDSGIRGTVIRLTDLKTLDFRGCDIVCEAGAQLSAVCTAALGKGLTGLEFAYGIPGTVGGAVTMNAGAYGGEMKDVVASATHLDENGLRQLSGDGLCFGYRHSAYSTGGRVVVSVCIRLKPGDPRLIGEKMDSLLERRKQKQPLEYPSAGSVFKRPPGGFAGTLIEQCGLKGAREGGAMVSEKHAGFIINTGGATCADVQRLVERVRNEVLRQTGTELECEIKTLA